MDAKITGASGAIPRDNSNKMTAHANLYYEEIRKRDSDIESIAQNTGFSFEDIKNIKNHIFFNEYDLGDEFPERFAPDFDMAVSWQRLSEGNNIHEMDIVLLNHELIEYKLMEKGTSYKEAHKIASKSYNYKKYTDELDKKFKERGLPNE